jgi:DNA-binding NarL/FixJ family response regulator
MTAQSLDHAQIGAGLGADHVRCTGLRVLVTLENDVVRWGLCSMLDALPTVRQATGCGTSHEALDLLSASDRDVVIASAALQDDALAKVSATVREAGAKLLLMLQDPNDEALARAAVQHADGFLLEMAMTPETLQDTLDRLQRNEMPMPATLARGLLSMVRRHDQGPARGPFLTPREQQTLDLLVDGYSNKQIARRLGISEHGAKRHVANVLAKLNCPNRTLAVAMALRDGLVGSPAR